MYYVHMYMLVYVCKYLLFIYNWIVATLYLTAWEDTLRDQVKHKKSSIFKATLYTKV